ncbi:hypothetical protein ACKWTF_010028 [Chironomus riparius]
MSTARVSSCSTHVHFFLKNTFQKVNLTHFRAINLLTVSDLEITHLCALCLNMKNMKFFIYEIYESFDFFYFILHREKFGLRKFSLHPLPIYDLCGVKYI